MFDDDDYGPTDDVTDPILSGQEYTRGDYDWWPALLFLAILLGGVVILILLFVGGCITLPDVSRSMASVEAPAVMPPRDEALWTGIYAILSGLGLMATWWIRDRVTRPERKRLEREAAVKAAEECFAAKGMVDRRRAPRQ